MPASCRGTHYYEMAHAFLNCQADHDNMANDLFAKISKEGESFGKTDCLKCGAYIVVSRRGCEWETRIFSRGPQKER